LPEVRAKKANQVKKVKGMVVKTIEELVQECADDEGKCAMRVYRTSGLFCPYSRVGRDGTPSTPCQYLGKIRVRDVGIGHSEKYRAFYVCDARKEK